MVRVLCALNFDALMRSPPRPVRARSSPVLLWWLASPGHRVGGGVWSLRLRRVFSGLRASLAGLWQSSAGLALHPLWVSARSVSLTLLPVSLPAVLFPTSTHCYQSLSSLHLSICSSDTQYSTGCLYIHQALLASSCICSGLTRCICFILVVLGSSVRPPVILYPLSYYCAFKINAYKSYIYRVSG